MRNVGQLACGQLKQHLDRELAHGRKGTAKPAELAARELLELAPEGAKVEVAEAMAMSLLQR